MATTALPLDSGSPNYAVPVTLEGRDYILHAHWSQRAFDSPICGGAGWFLSIHDAADQPIATGARIVLGALLFARTRDPRMPGGAFFASDSTTQDQEATRTDLGERVFVFYTDLADLP